MDKTYKTVELSENKSAVVLVPEIEGQLAIVHLATIQRLARMLPKANLHEIKQDMRDRIMDTHTIEKYVAVLEEELAFHKSINLIREYKPDERTDIA